MLPFLLASVFGIIIFSFNIFFINNKVHTVNSGLSVKSQNKISQTSIKANSGLDNAITRLNSEQGSKTPVTRDLSSRNKQVAVKPEAQNLKNVRATVPARENNSQRVEVNKTGTSINVLSQTKTQNWLIQAGAFSIESSAVKIKDKIALLGFGVEIVKTGAAKPLYKIMVSPGNSGSDPNDALKKLKSNGIDGYIAKAERP
jgi:cell division protein FtsN